jgi:hypothetical protein
VRITVLQYQILWTDCHAYVQSYYRDVMHGRAVSLHQQHEILTLALLAAHQIPVSKYANDLMLPCRTNRNMIVPRPWYTSSLFQKIPRRRSKWSSYRRTDIIACTAHQIPVSKSPNSMRMPHQPHDAPTRRKYHVYGTSPRFCTMAAHAAVVCRAHPSCVEDVPLNWHTGVRVCVCDQRPPRSGFGTCIQTRGCCTMSHPKRGRDLRIYARKFPCFGSGDVGCGE